MGFPKRHWKKAKRKFTKGVRGTRGLLIQDEVGIEMKKARVRHRIKTGVVILANNANQAKRWAKRHSYKYGRLVSAKNKSRRATYFVRY